MKRIALLLLSTTLALPVTGQQIHKWVDEEGTVHFSDSPPPESVRAQVIDLPPNPPAAHAPPSGTHTPADETASAAEAAVARPSARERREACERAMADRTTLLNMPIIARDLDGDGVPERLTDEQRAAELERAERLVTLLCGQRRAPAGDG